MASPSSLPVTSGMISNNEGDINKAQTPENEGSFCNQDVVEGPQLPVNVEKYPARIISEDVDLALVTLSWLAPEIDIIRARRQRVFDVKVGILREFQTAMVIQMAEVPKNFWQHRVTNATAERL
jgi:hypothetical protein